MLKIIEVSRNLGPGYIPADCQSVSGNLLNFLFSTRFADVMKTLLLEARIFEISISGDGATIKSVSLINILAAGPKKPFALLGASKSIFDQIINAHPLIHLRRFIRYCQLHVSRGGRR